MRTFFGNLRFTLLLLTGFTCFPAICRAAAISASATFSDVVLTPGVYNYNITLQNTGSTNIGTFWFAWVPGAGFLTATPSVLGNPAGWTSRSTNAGAGIQWVTTTSALAAGQTLSGFTFTSTEAPSALLLNVPSTGAGAGLPVTTSFVYIGAPLGDPGYEFAVTPAASAVTPEPESLVLTLTGAGLLLVVAAVSRSSLLHP